MYVSPPYPEYANSTLANRDNPDQVIMCIKLPGRVIPESIFRTEKAKLSPIKFDRFFEQ